MTAPLTFVKVERHPFGISQFSECMAELEDDDSVTVTCTQDGRIMQHFPAGSWRTALVLTDRGMPLYAYVSKVEQDERHEKTERAMAHIRRTRYR